MRSSFILHIAIMALGITTSWAQNKPNTRIITADFHNAKGAMNTMYKECIGAGRANEGLRADWQQQLAITKKECDFKYIRMHGLLTDDMGVYMVDSKGNPQYNFQYIDALYDYLLSIHIKPFVELGFMPSALASGPETIFWWRGNVTPPNDYNRWEELIRNLTQHFTDRYGVDEVKTWYFEVWNEPNLSPGFWTGTQQDYFKLYQHSARAIKSVNSQYRVGGPATAGAAWEPEFIAFCKTNNVPVDFVSTHAYGVRQGFLDEYGSTGTVLDNNPMTITSDVLTSRNEINASAYPGLELHYTEWSSSYTPADALHDSYHEAPFILEKLKQVGDAANSMSYWVFTDIFEEAGPRFTPFHGGFGLMNTQGIKKPAYYAYSYLNKLGETELVNNDSTSWICKNANGDIQLLMWDFTYTLPDSVNNQQYFIRDLPAKDKALVKINIAGVPEGNYQMEISKIGYQINDAYGTYLSLNKPNQLTPQQVELIKSKNNGAPISTENIRISNKGAFAHELKIRENEVILITIKHL